MNSLEIVGASAIYIFGVLILLFVTAFIGSKFGNGKGLDGLL